MIETLLVTAAMYLYWPRRTSWGATVVWEWHWFKTQLQLLPNLVRTRNVKVPNRIPTKSVTNVRIICDIMNEINISKEMSEVLKLLKIFYTIPVTTSSAERTFSALRRLKTYLRSTMSQLRLNYMMLLYIHKEKMRLMMPLLPRIFIMENERRRHIFWQHVIMLCVQ